MAIVNSVLLGTTRGSVGNVTLRRSGGETIASQKVSRVSNPRSYAQAEQRMRMAAAGAAYSSLSAVLAKSWQGKTRVQSQSEFTRAAIRTMADGLYGHIKGYGMVPYPFQVSKGTLPALPLNAIPDAEALNSLDFGPSTSAAWGTLTLGQMYNDFANYLGVSYKRLQLTFIVVFGAPDDGNVIRFTPRWFRLILSQGDSSVVTFPSWLPSPGWVADDTYTLIFPISGATNLVYAATVIASGWDGRKWVRSTQRLMVTPGFTQTWQNNYDASVATYMDSAALADPEGDVYLDGEGARRAPAAEFDWSTVVVKYVNGSSPGVDVTGITTTTFKTRTIAALSIDGGTALALGRSTLVSSPGAVVDVVNESLMTITEEEQAQVVYIFSVGGDESLAAVKTAYDAVAAALGLPSDIFTPQ